MQQVLSDDERCAFENYLLAGENQAQKEKSLDNLVEGSIPYYYLYFIDKLKTGGVAAMTQKDNEMFAKFTETQNFRNTTQARQIKLWHTLLKIDIETDMQKRDEYIAFFESEYLHFDFKSHVKPQPPAGIKGDESSQEEDEQQHVLPKDFFLADNQQLIKKELELLKERVEKVNQQDKSTEAKAKQVHNSLVQTHFSSLQTLINQGDAIQHEIDFGQFMPQAVYQFLVQFAQSNPGQIAAIQNKTFFESITSYIDYLRTQDAEEFKYFSLSESLVKQLTIQQMDTLSQLQKWFSTDDNFIGAYFEKQFSEEMSTECQEMWSTEEKFSNMERLYGLAKSQQLPKAFQREFLEEILSLGTKTGNFSMTHFKEYIDLTSKDQLSIFQEYADAQVQLRKNRTDAARVKATTNWCQYIQNVRPSSNSGNSSSGVKEIIDEYLNYFCEKANGSLSEFSKDFTQSYLKGIEKKIKVYLAKDGLKSLDENEIGLDYFKSIAEQVQLEFSKSNKEIFEIQEEVQLDVIIKNIQSLHVKIFEFNTETYYKKNLTPFNTGVNLDGLDASESFKFTYEQGSNIRHHEIFKLPQLNNKIGLFIVEMIGNGVSARAVIKKGSLSLVHRSTVAGHLAYILDAKKNICSSEKTGVWFDKKYYPADLESGRIFIPYGKSDLNSKIIMINGEFAQLGDFTQKTESYSFSAQFYLHQESVLVGASTNVIVRAQLMINGRKAALSMLKNVKIVLTTYNYIDNIPVTKTFQNLSFLNDQELSVSFQVPPNLRDINAVLTCEVLNATTKKMESFSESHKFDVISPNSASVDLMAMPYLKKVKGDHFVYILGKNGEPRTKQLVNLQMIHRIASQSTAQTKKNNYNTTRTTNKQGAINLGPLIDVINLKAETDIGARAQWDLSFQTGQNGSYFSYPGSIEVLEGESIDLPICLRVGQVKLDRKWLSIIRKNNGAIVEDWFNNVKLVHCGDDKMGYHKITVDSLQQGSYILSFVSGHSTHVCNIKVHKGAQWECAEGFILKKSCLQENMQSAILTKISNVEIHSNDIPDERVQGHQNNHQVTVTVANCTKSVHLHAFAHHFIPGNQMQFTRQIEQLQMSQFSSSVFPFAKWQNLYQSNRHMADEIRYVFDRKQLESQLGNTLDRPTLLSKRNFLQKTTQDSENLHSGDPFAYQQEQQQQMQYMQQRCVPAPSYSMMSNMQPHHQQQRQQSQMIQMCMPQASYRNNNYASAYHDMATGEGRHHGGLVMVKTEPSEFYNFLKCPPIQKLNLVPVLDGDNATFKFDCDLTPFTQLVLIAVDKESVTQRTIDIDVNEIQRRDLRLQNTLNPDEGLTESRITMPLNEKDQDFIKDITSTEVQIVDDLSKVSEILSEIRKVKGTNNGEFSAFDFVKKWHTITTNEKDRYFSDYYCHELNFFIFKRDPSYFKQTVKPFLQCKMEKQFFDHYLLGNTREIVKHAEFHLIGNLNVLEKCLLVETLQKSKQDERASSIAALMQQEWQAVKARDSDSVNYNNRIFDLVLNLNKLNEDKSQMDLLKRRPKPAPAAELYDLPSDMSSFDSNQPPVAMFCGGPPGGIHVGGFGGLFGAAPQRMQMQQQLRRARCSSEDEEDECCESISQTSGYGGAEIQTKSYNRRANFDDCDYSGVREKAMAKQGFEEVESTSEYTETHYYNQASGSSSTFVTINQYWCDYANHLISGKGSFLSQNFTDCTENERASFFVLCTLDLQMSSSVNHLFKPDEQRGVLIEAASSLLLFKKEIKPCGLDLSRNDIMVIHRYKEEIAGQSAKEEESGKPDQFLARTAYACEVVITNVAPKAKQFSLLYQVPEGAIPLRQTKYMKSQHIALQPYTTQKIVFHFYFPTAGKYQHFPSNISVEGVVTARGGANEIVVVDSRRLTKIESFQDILHAGTKDDILTFLKTENLYSFKKYFNFHSIMWLLKDKAFFDSVISILRQRNIFEWSVWRYAFYHKQDLALMRECLSLGSQSNVISQIGAHFKSGLIDVDELNADNRTFTKHLEYHPMVNSRAHLLGRDRKILNATFRQTYDRFLSSLVQKRAMSTEDKMIIVYYLQLQDRVQEAIDLFRQIEDPKEEQATLKIQYDYLQAYFDFFSGAEDGFKSARRIVQKYDNHPVASWRMMFLTIADQLNEYDGEFDNEEEMLLVDRGGVAAQDAMIREQRKLNKKNFQKREPNMSVEVDSQGTLKLETTNIQTVVVKYYIINAELLFSRQPFLKDNTEGFSYVKPFHTLSHTMCKSDATEEELNQYTKAEIAIPEKLLNQNMVIEVTSSDLQKFLTFYSNQLKVTVLEQYGELKVTHALTGLALPRTYVKVFSQKKQGGEIFYRDGYTDIRGKIEYAQTSGDKLKDVKKFAILVQNDTYGSRILECDPPKGVTGNDQPVAGLPQASFENQKIARLENRQQYASKQKMSRK